MSTGRLSAWFDGINRLREQLGAPLRHDLVLADPPYEQWGQHSTFLAELVPPILEQNGVVVVETSARVEPELPLDLVTTRRYGSARITVFSR